MSGAKNTRGVVVDYSQLAGKGRNSIVKQNGSHKDVSNAKVNLDVKTKNKVLAMLLEKHEKALEKDRNIFTDMLAKNIDSKSEEFKMAVMECGVIDPEITLNKRVRKQIIGNVKDKITGNVMPVVLEELVDGTKPKKSLKNFSHKPGMAGDGGNALDLSTEVKQDINDSVILGKRETRILRSSTKQKQRKIDSDLEIVDELSGDSDGVKFSKNVKVPRVELSLKTSIDSSEDDLDSDLDRHRVLIMKDNQEQKGIGSVSNKLKRIQKKDSKAKEVRVYRDKENKKEHKEIVDDAPKGKSGKSVKILDEQIKENEQALLQLLEQARKCVESSEASDNDLEVELPTFKSNQRKTNKSSGKDKLKKTINKVRAKLDAENEQSEAHSKRMKLRAKKRSSKKSRR